LKEIRFEGKTDLFDAASLAKVNVDQFFGIEIEEFPVRIAEVAMWMTDHIMNVRLSAAFGKSYVRIPLRTSPNIRNADALEIEWPEVLAPESCSYVLGNPPFYGSKEQSARQRQQVRSIANLGGSGGTLDYVCAWFVRAGEYLKWSKARVGFVATNSITQGEQVAQLWPLLFDRYGLEIAFAHRTFEWMSDARGKAHVHCVIIGLVSKADEPVEKRLFTYDKIRGDPAESRHSALTAYLTDGSKLRDRHLVVYETTKNLSGAVPLVYGNMPNDGGHLILSAEEKVGFAKKYPDLSKLVRRLVGADDLINGLKRYCLWLVGVQPEVFRKNDFIHNRLKLVADYRSKSSRAATKRLAQTPYLFGEIRQVDGPFAIIPRHSSETREYVPVGFQLSGEIAHDSCLFLPNANLWNFGLIVSRMHMAWLRNIGGRLKSDYRYSIGIVYNPFPWPDGDEKTGDKIRNLAQAVLDARNNHPDSILADLYDPDVMPPDLRKAHKALDEAVDRLYRKEPFQSDRERVEHLFKVYEDLTAPMLAVVSAPKKRRRKVLK
jgi:hypothetical protein